VIYQKLVRSIV